MIFLLITLGLVIIWLVSFLWTALPGLTSLTATMAVQAGWSATLTAGGGASALSALANSSTIKKSTSISTSISNGSAGGGNELYSLMTALTASSSASVDLTSVSDIMNQTAGSLARVKDLMIWLLSAADDSVNGTAAAYIKVDATVTNGLASQAGSGWMEAVSIFDVVNGGVLAYLSASAAGVAVDGTHKVIKLTNGDGALTANVLMTLFGAGS